MQHCSVPRIQVQYTLNLNLQQDWIEKQAGFYDVSRILSTGEDISTMMKICAVIAVIRCTKDTGIC